MCVCIDVDIDMRFYDLQRGAVLLDGVDLRELNVRGFVHR